ncbi:RDD family protein [Cellulomonas cellasea]|uniref:RDD family protein n=1 Tax=Cellulomonas cellasea TaxID=43670 RepID=UPI0025A401DD|nr:RDD family protein [Cellulomonas cellasea]MDM8084875.1 RDD family protein [Cellulomonas cellasea]
MSEPASDTTPAQSWDLPTGEHSAIPVPFASWLMRLIAVLLDQALVAGVAFLASGSIGYEGPTLHPGVANLIQDPSGTSVVSGWVVATLALMALLQAYLGATPGKWIMGIAVVRTATGRPAGALLTVLRTVSHLLDSILLIGYLRPLVNRERRTFADSIAGTYVLATRRPLPWVSPLVDQRGGWIEPPPPWEEPAQPRWRRVVGSVVITAGVLGMAFSCAPTSGTSGGISLQCWAPSDTDGTAGPVLTEAWATAQSSNEWTRLGVTRGDRTLPRLDVTWQLMGDYQMDDVSFAASQDTWWATVRGADGAVIRTIRVTSAQAIDGLTGATFTGDTVKASVPWEAVDEAVVGAWTLEAGQTRGGQAVASCSAF